MLNGDKPLPEMTASQFHAVMLDHARVAKSRSLSYHDVALQIGRLVVLVGVVWWLLKFPGVPIVRDWWWQHVVPHETPLWTITVGGFLLLGVLEEARWHWRCPEGLREPLGKPKQLVGDLVHSTQLLLGIATIGIVAIVPGAYVVFLLGLNAR